MDAPAYSAVTAVHFDRLLTKLALKHPELLERLDPADCSPLK